MMKNTHALGKFFGKITSNSYGKALFCFISCMIILAGNCKADSKVSQDRKIIKTNPVKLLYLEEKNKIDKKIEDQAYKVAKDLQNVLASKLLNSMYQGPEDNKVIGVSNGEKIFRSMLNDEYAKSLDLKLVEPIKKDIIKKYKMNNKNNIAQIKSENDFKVGSSKNKNE